MLANIVRVLVFLVFAVGAGLLAYLDDRVLGGVIAALAGGLVLIGFLSVIGLIWIGLRGLWRTLVTPPEPDDEEEEPARPLAERAASGRP